MSDTFPVNDSDFFDDGDSFFFFLFSMMNSELEQLCKQICEDLGFTHYQFVFDEANHRFESKLEKNPDLGFKGKNGCTPRRFVKFCFKRTLFEIVRTDWAKRFGRFISFDKYAENGMDIPERLHDRKAIILLLTNNEFTNVIEESYLLEVYDRCNKGLPHDDSTMSKYFECSEEEIVQVRLSVQDTLENL